MNAMAPLHFPDGCKRWPHRGFTLIELMVTVSVLAVVLALGVPSFVNLIAQNRMATQTNEFVSSLNLTRMEAVRRSQSVTMRSIDTASNSSKFETGWQVFTDANGNGSAAVGGSAAQSENTDGFIIRDNGALAGNTTVRRVSQTASGGSVTYAALSASDSMRVTFNSRGALASGSNAFFRICDSGRSTLPGRIVQVAPVGRISLVSTTTSCQ